MLPGANVIATGCKQVHVMSECVKSKRSFHWINKMEFMFHYRRVYAEEGNG